MSGICGIYRRDGREVFPQDLEPTLDAMSYYGLDNRSFWNNGPIGLAHLLTRVTPESFHEELPFEQADTQLTITADVRLDNRDELFSIFTIPASEQACFPDSQLMKNTLMDITSLRV